MARPRHKSAPGVAPVPHHPAEGVELRSATARALDTASWVVIVAGVILIPLWVSPTGEDSFRYPKELLFRGEAIVLTAILALYLILVPREFPLREIPRSLWILVCAILGWTGVTTMTSTNLELSVRSLLWVAACAIVFLCSYATLRGRSEKTIWIAIVPSLLNAAIAILQSRDIWHPVETETQLARAEVVGLMGNPNDVGALLVAPTLIALGVSLSSRRTIPALMAAGVLLLGIVATATFTAIVAVALGLLVLIFSLRRRIALALILAVAIALTALITFDGPVKRRLQWKLDQFAQRNYDVTMSRRLGSSLVAMEMVSDRPVLGSGPGTYGWNYFQYRIRVVDKYSDLLGTADPRRRSTSNFGEAHNDHLEIASETGLPGYLLFIASLIWIGRRGASASADATRRLTRSTLAGVVVATLGLFPLQLAATTVVLLFFAGFVSASVPWGRGGSDRGTDQR